MSESSGLPPEQEAVRRLLADARHTAPPPPEVVARLDDTLAALESERAAERGAGRAAEGSDAHDDRSPGRVVDLGSRRRRIASIGLLAAASVVVAGVAIGQALPRGAGDAGESSAGSQSDSSLAETGDAGGTSADSGTDSGSGAGSDSGAGSEPAPESLKSSPAITTDGLPSLSTADADLDAQLLALREDATGRRQATSLDALGDCEIPRPGRSASVLTAEIDGQVGVVVFRRPVEEAQGVELYVCGVAAPARTITLPAP